MDNSLEISIYLSSGYKITEKIRFKIISKCLSGFSYHLWKYEADSETRFKYSCYVNLDMIPEITEN